MSLFLVAVPLIAFVFRQFFFVLLYFAVVATTICVCVNDTFTNNNDKGNLVMVILITTDNNEKGDLAMVIRIMLIIKSNCSNNNHNQYCLLFPRHFLSSLPYRPLVSGFDCGMWKCWSYVGCYTLDKIIPFPPNTGCNILNAAWNEFL